MSTLFLSAAAAALLATALPVVATAQPVVPAPAASAAPATVPVVPSAPRTDSSPTLTLGYRSAFENYKPFGDQPIASWEKANAAVGVIGGWRAYAREAQSDAPARGAAPQAAPSSPAGRAVAPAGGHSGHKMP